jgi:hypothetical protein
MNASQTGTRDCDDFYRDSMERLTEAGVPFLVGGAYAFGVYTGISRDTKDFDLFLQSDDVERALSALGAAGYATDRPYPHWLAKAKCGENVIDLIYAAGNGLCRVDESWFERACPAELLGKKVKLCAPEEILWMKAFIMERERFDGADIIHLIDSYAEKMDWEHLVHRFGPDWPVLLSHLILFGYVFPGESARVPNELVNRLSQRLMTNGAPMDPRLCRGTLLSRQQYIRDIEERGFKDARLETRVHMNGEDIARWTDGIAVDGSAR